MKLASRVTTSRGELTGGELTGGERTRPWTAAPRRLRARCTPLVLALAAVALGAPAAAASGPAQDPAQDEAQCESGVFCAWPEQQYGGSPHSADLRTTNMEECVPLSGDLEAHSFVNRLNRPVTVYQDAHCGTRGEFSTYPEGSFVPRSPFVVRAFKIWTH
ncbi:MULTISPECIES: peptidase inhibitor family I36 protein [unclassified Actinopolyspora]|uniref:peptidase inhibitor family I36 protein n=1 Tax=unclassified Actinopolyspora TaxID=2639451 RepID=UPI0013F5E253|nr:MULTISPECIES: peptidase inhibitor family I36 protein [unclassified Actinopolyspora]NHD18176.1 peptidase inhibitor family I36 protein [Actinopolyspora sp. BKK2]NHE77147.1 peptidase inhibitor family I36 protein [Actinopolyspora sp. BKK1]